MTTPTIWKRGRQVVHEHTDGTLVEVIDANGKPSNVQFPSSAPWNPTLQEEEVLSVTSKALRIAWQANRIQRAASNPGRYAKNRAKSKLLGSVGFWRGWSRWWRA